MARTPPSLFFEFFKNDAQSPLNIQLHFNRGAVLLYRVATRGAGIQRNSAQGMMVNTAYRVTFLAIFADKLFSNIETETLEYCQFSNTDLEHLQMFSIKTLSV